VSGEWRYDGRILAAEHLPRRLTGVTRVVVRPGTIVTQLAREDLSQRGITIGQESPAAPAAATAAPGSGIWVGSDRDYPVLSLALSLAGGTTGETHSGDSAALAAEAGRWRRDNPDGAVVIFTAKPELAAWEAGKASGSPAAAVCGVPQASRAMATLGKPILAVEMPGRTAYEIRQILRLAGAPGRLS